MNIYYIFLATFAIVLVGISVFIFTRKRVNPNMVIVMAPKSKEKNIIILDTLTISRYIKKNCLDLTNYYILEVSKNTIKVAFTAELLEFRMDNENVKDLTVESINNIMQLEARKIWLNGCRITDEILDSIIWEFNTESISLSNNYITRVNTFLTSMLVKSEFSITRLQHLDISRNPLTSLTDDISQIQDLNTLNLAYTKIKILEPTLSHLENLRILHLPFNEIQSIPSDLIDKRDLTITNNEKELIDISLLKLIRKTQNIFPGKNMSIDLQNINLSNMNLEKFPKSLTSLNGTKTLDLSFNMIEKIPDSIEKMQNLSYLYISNNKIAEIPDSLCRLKYLICLKAQKNKIKILPNTIGSLENLQYLDLGQNELEYLPESFYELNKLKEVNLEQNKRNIDMKGFYIKSSYLEMENI